MRDVAIVSFAQYAVAHTEHDEVEMLVPVITEVIERSGIPKKEIGFTVSGSCDYLGGRPFSFVMALDAVGAWPPISESHVEMDGAWALYEAWVRLQHGDIDSALVYAFGRSSQGATRSVRARAARARLDQPRRAPSARDARRRAVHRARHGGDRRAQPARRDGESRCAREGGRAGRRLAEEPVRGLAAPRARLPTGERRRRRGGARGGGSRAQSVQASGLDSRDRSSHRAALAGRARSHAIAVDVARGEEGRRARAKGRPGRDPCTLHASGDHRARRAGPGRRRRDQSFRRLGGRAPVHRGRLEPRR